MKSLVIRYASLFALRGQTVSASGVSLACRSCPVKIGASESEGDRCISRCWHSPQQRQCGYRCLVACWQSDSPA